MMMNKVKIIIVDDHAIFRDGLKSVLSLIKDFIVINEASTGTELLNILKQQLPDIILMDISMPEMDGIEATEKALKKYPDLKSEIEYFTQDQYLETLSPGIKRVIQRMAKEAFENGIE